MVFVTRRPGETLVLQTPSGKLVIQVLKDNQLKIDVPAGVKVADSAAESRNNSWLPARPRLVHVS